MMTSPSVFERLREYKKEIALPALGAAIVIMIVALFGLNHSAAFSPLKGVVIALESAIVILGIVIRSIRLTLLCLCGLFVVSGM